MPRFAANLSMLFTEVPFLDRFKAAREAGFTAVEFLFPYEYGLENVRAKIQENGLEAVLFNLPAGNWAAGERGIAANPERVAEFRAGVEQAAAWAVELGVPRLNCLAGKEAATVTAAEQEQVLKDNIRYAAAVLQDKGLKLMLEPINHYDIPGFMLNTSYQVLQLIAEVGAPNVYLQYDVYHAQREEGELAATIRKHIQQIGHIQIADNPGRHQPGTGEINYKFLLQELDNLGYEGYVSLEYVPQPDTLTSLNWISEHGFKLD
jgi:hydroxypyruvate isomerase